MTSMLIAISVLCGIGLAMALLLAVGKRAFAVEVDPRFEQLMDVIPGANCGGCGLPGCSGYASALLAGTAAPDACPPGGAELTMEIGRILGMEVTVREPEVALVRCAGGNSESPIRARYDGIDDCRAAHALAGGFKSCTHGCLGLGSCIAACTFNAIERTANGLVRIDPERCTGCRNCIAACPRHIIAMVPKKEVVHVLCINPDKAKDVKAVCTVGCTGCKICGKQSPRMVFDGALARVSTDANDPLDPSVALSCPQGSIYDAREYRLSDWLSSADTRKHFEERAAAWKEAEKARKAGARKEKPPKKDDDQPASSQQEVTP